MAGTFSSQDEEVASPPGTFSKDDEPLWGPKPDPGNRTWGPNDELVESPRPANRLPSDDGDTSLSGWAPQRPGEATRKASAAQAQEEDWQAIDRRYNVLRSMTQDPEKRAALDEAYARQAATHGVEFMPAEGVSVPKIRPGEIKALFPSAPDWFHKAAAGALRGGAELADGLLAPESVAALAMPEARIPLGAGMASQLAADYPKQVAAFSQALGAGDTENIFRTGIAVAAPPLMAAAGAAAKLSFDEAKGEPNAIDSVDQPAGVQPERANGNAGGQTAETGGGDSLQPEAGGPEAAGPGPRTAAETRPPSGEGTQLPVVPPGDGAEFVASTPQATAQVAGRYDVVEHGDLVTSFDPRFDPALQPRDRSRAASVNQIATIAQRLEPQRLGESPTSDTGAPIVDERNQVLSGNGRSAALGQLYATGRGGVYKDWLTQNAADFDFDPEQIAAMQDPVLVRRVTDFGDMGKTEFARQSNQAQVLGMGEGEKAAADAKLLLGNPGLLDHFRPGEDGNVLAASNRDFLNQFIQGTGDQAELLTKEGYNAAAVTKRVKNAVLGALLGPENQTLLGRLTEGADALNIKTPVNGVMQAAPQLLRLKGTDWDLGTALHQAMKDLVTIKTSGEKVSDFLDSQSLFGDAGRTAQSDMLLQHLAEAKSMKSVTEGLMRYAQAARQSLQDAQSGGMFGLKPAGQTDILQRIYGRQESPSPAQADFPLAKSGAGAETGGDAGGPSGSQAANPAPGVEPGGTPVEPKTFKSATSAPAGGRLTAPPPPQAVPPSAPLPAGSPLARPTAVNPIVAQLGNLRRWFQNHFAPQSIDPTARIFSTMMRWSNAKEANDLAVADERMAAYRKEFDRTPVPGSWRYDPNQPLPHNYQVIDAFERNRAALPAHLQKLADVFDDEFRWRMDMVRNFKPDALRQVIGDYFPHMWKNPDSAAVRSFMAEVAARAPLEGSKAFLKQRTIPFFAEGLARGLEPISDNPVDLLLAKMHQAGKFLAAQHILQQATDAGMRRYLPLGRPTPDGWRVVDDPAFTVHAPPYLEVREAFDAGLRRDLLEFIRKMGFSHERVANLGVNTWGQYTTGGKIQSRFGGPDGVIMHELGHGLDERYGLYGVLARDAVSRAELEALARERARHGGGSQSQAFRRYTQTPEEQVANAVHAYLYAPELMQRVSPNVRTTLRAFIAAHPELHDLEAMKPSLAIASSKTRLPLAGPVLAGHYIMPEGAAQVLTNHLSPGLADNAVYRTARAASNVLNAAQLGFSGFHVGFTSLDAAFSTLGTAITEAARGGFKEAGKLAARSLVAPLANYYSGKIIQNEMLRPGSGRIRALGFRVPYDQAAAARLADLAVRGGLRATVDPFWRTALTRNMVRAFRENSPAGYLRGAMRLPFALVEQSVRPIAEYIVPRQKLGTFATLAAQEMRRLGPGASHEEVSLAMARAADATENRLGQMTYDNLFYNRVAKDMSLLGFRAYGWQLGKYRELAGVVGDSAKFLAAAARDLSGRNTGQAPAAFTNRMGYGAAMVMGAAAIGGILHRLFTGQNPQSAVDYFHPAVGRNDADGRPVRLSLPTYLKDLESDWRDFPQLDKMGSSFYHKLNPALDTAVDVLRKRDFYDVRIRNEDDPLIKQWADTAKFVFRNAEPFSIAGAAKLREQGAGAAETVLPFFGFVPAKKALTMTPAETRAAELTQASLPQGTRTQEQFDHTQMLKQLAQDLRADPAQGRMEIRGAMQNGQMRPDELASLITRSRLTPLQYQAHKMTADDAMKVWDLANPSERASLREILAAKVAGAKTLDSATRQRYLRALYAASPGGGTQ